MMPMVALSVTEAELFAAVMTVQDMLFIMRIVESMGRTTCGIANATGDR
jgi:hypothetical protein